LPESVLDGNSVSDYDLVHRFNIKDKGYYNGIELSIGEQMTFLPRPFNTLGIQANLTLIDVLPIRTRRVLVLDDPAQNAAMVDQAGRALDTNAIPLQGNIIINWRHRKLAFLAAVSHTGRTLRSVSRQIIKYSNLDEQYMITLTRNEPRTVVDLKIEYRWNRHFVPYLQLRNLFNSRATQTINGYYVYEINSPWPAFEIGIRGLF
jgi:outer membrane receptor protein involved in Fe transport